MTAADSENRPGVRPRKSPLIADAEYNQSVIQKIFSARAQEAELETELASSISKTGGTRTVSCFVIKRHSTRL